MISETTLKEVMMRLAKAMTLLEEAVEQRFVNERNHLKKEVMQSFFASDKDQAGKEAQTLKAQVERLEAVNKEVSRRLVSAMEKIRIVLEK